ncbi:MAG: tRNA lysidine(34) synthetase TilS [Defluviitaleaceae bacterium]|nr:tRNA lysidine(34) synthetase TilS [Defluviitaleaceae bacterium]
MDKIISTIEKYGMIPQNSRILVALSGGADSVCLLVCLNLIKVKYNAEIFAVHINHMLRSAALVDEQFVENLCKNLGIPLTIHRADVKEAVKKLGISEELAGRQLRYDCFYKELEEKGCDLIATGHNKNDNAETIFMNIVRGAGMQGLCGIPAVRENIIRPLIELERYDIEAFLHEHNIKYRIDETNLQDVYSRNKVRNSIFPFIEKNFNISLTSNLCRLSDIIKDDNDFLSQEASKYYSECKTSNNNANGLLLDPFNNLHDAVKRRVIRLLFLDAAGSIQNLEYTHIESVLSICKKGTGKFINLPGGFIAKRVNDAIYIGAIKENTEFCYDLKVDQALFIPELGKTVKVSFCNELSKLNDSTTNACTNVFNYDIMKDGMKIRSRKNGDKIYIDGLGGHKKLSDYFIDNKIPQDERYKTPLLVCGSDILWIMDVKGITNGRYSSKNAARKIYVSVY